MKLRIIFMGTPDFAVPSLKKLISESGNKDSEFELVAVFTQPDRAVGRGLETRPSAVKVEALRNGLRVEQPEKLSQAKELLRTFNADIFVVAAYGQLLNQEVLDLPRLGCINIHSSLLPRWRGAAPIHWALLSGDAETGVSIQKMVLKLDAGPVLGEVRTPIHETDTLPVLHDRLAEMAPGLLMEVLRKIVKNEISESPQDESKVTYASKLTKEMENLVPSKTAKELERQCRALIPWPGVSLHYELQSPLTKRVRLKVHAVKLVREKIVPEVKEGILAGRGQSLYLGTRSGLLELLEVQLEGKRKIHSAEFLNGATSRGEVFEVRVV